jgi:hypothetical protein
MGGGRPAEERQALAAAAIARKTEALHAMKRHIAAAQTEVNTLVNLLDNTRAQALARGAGAQPGQAGLYLFDNVSAAVYRPPRDAEATVHLLDRICGHRSDQLATAAYILGKERVGGTSSQQSASHDSTQRTQPRSHGYALQVLSRLQARGWRTLDPEASRLHCVRALVALALGLDHPATRADTRAAGGEREMSLGVLRYARARHRVQQYSASAPVPADAALELQEASAFVAAQRPRVQAAALRFALPVLLRSGLLAPAAGPGAGTGAGADSGIAKEQRTIASSPRILVLPPGLRPTVWQAFALATGARSQALFSIVASPASASLSIASPCDYRGAALSVECTRRSGQGGAFPVGPMDSAALPSAPLPGADTASRVPLLTALRRCHAAADVTARPPSSSTSHALSAGADNATHGTAAPQLADDIALQIGNCLYNVDVGALDQGEQVDSHNEAAAFAEVQDVCWTYAASITADRAMRALATAASVFGGQSQGQDPNGPYSDLDIGALERRHIFEYLCTEEGKGPASTLDPTARNKRRAQLLAEAKAAPELGGAEGFLALGTLLLDTLVEAAHALAPHVPRADVAVETDMRGYTVTVSAGIDAMVRVSLLVVV